MAGLRRPKRGMHALAAMERSDEQSEREGLRGPNWQATTICRTGSLRCSSGMRSNVDERSGTLRIDRALSETKQKGVFFKKPKGKRTRTIALPPLLTEALNAHRKE